MPPFRKPNLITLRRHELSQPWGFRLAGGENLGQPFVVQKVIPESIAHKSGLQEGDQLVRIGNITLKGLTHEEVQEIILRCSSTIDLFVIRNPNSEESQNPSVDQQTVVNKQFSPYVSGAKSLTEQVLNRMSEDAYYTSNCVDYTNPMSPPLQQIYVKEREMYEYSEYQSSPPLRTQSPLVKPPPSGRPFSPVVSPTNISYHQPEEQQWLSSQDQMRGGVRPKSPIASPLAHQQTPSPKNDGQRDSRVFGVRPRGSSPSPSPVANGERDNRVFGSRPATSSATPSPVNSSHKSEDKRDDRTPTLFSPQPTQDIRQMNTTENQYQKTSHSPQDKLFYAQNKRAETFKNHSFDRPGSGRVVNDRRIFATNPRSRLQKFGGSLDETPHWKEPLPQLRTNRKEVNQLLPSQTKQQQTYIVQTPPTERNARPPPTGTLRRRIRPVWPPPDASGKYVPKTGFSPSGRDSPTTRYDWPPSKSQSFDEEYYENGIMSPNPYGSSRMRYSTPPPGPLQRSWNPRSGSETPPTGRAYTPTQRVKNSAWPPPSNATPAGRSGYRPQQSLPGSRRSSQADEYYTYTINHRIPQTYRPPPNTQYFEQSYHYDTD